MGDTHYEVLVAKGSSWSILTVLYDESKAVGEAKEQMRTGRYHAVKVMRNKFDPDSGTFIERQVFSDGKMPKKGKTLDDGPANFCWRIEDIYSYEGRLTLRRLMQEELDRWRITPIELIHSADHVERLENHGTTLQRVVQRVAIAQCQETGKPVHERMRELYDLATAAAEQVRGDWKAKRVPAIEPHALPGLLEKLKAEGRASTFLNYALSGYLKDAADWRQKLEMVIDLLALSENELLLKSTDIFIAEILGATTALKDTFGQKPTFGTSLRILVELYHGRAKLTSEVEDAIAPARLERLNGLMASMKLPITRIELGKRITKELKIPKALTDGALLAEGQAIKALHQAMMGEGGALIGGEESFIELCKRSERLLNSETINAFVGSVPGPVERAELLLKLEQNLLGSPSKRKLADYLLPLITSPHHESAYLQSSGTPMERLERLERLQRTILASELMPAHRDKAAQHLDGFSMRILKEAQLFDRVRKSDRTEVEKAMVVLRLCAARTFTQGRTLEFARSEARAYMKTPNFIELYLAGAADNSEMARRLMELQQLLEAAGMRAESSAQSAASSPAPEPAAKPEASPA